MVLPLNRADVRNRCREWHNATYDSQPSSACGNWIKWLVSVLLIVVVWRFGVYGMDWTSWKSIAALLVAIAVLAF
jgi:hypothetical protein